MRIKTMPVKLEVFRGSRNRPSANLLIEMVIAFDFYQHRKNRNIILFITKLFFLIFLHFFLITTKMFLNEQNGMLEILAMEESKDLKKSKRLKLDQLETCSPGDTIILGFIYKIRRGKNKVNHSQVLFHFHYSSQIISSKDCLNRLTF